VAAAVEQKSLLEALAEVPDPRSRHGRRYSIQSILAMAVCAMACGARSIAAISQWGKEHRELAREALGLTRERTPDGATVHRLFRRLDVEAFEKVLRKWLRAQGLRPGEGIAIDGKGLRGLHGEKAPGVDLVAAYAHQRGVVLDQQGVEAEGQELKAAKQILKRLRLAGHVVTGDALLAQQRICTDIIAKGGTTSSD
jgi:DDE_Tnp_1-associated/Transposase DDE domain